jgi:hypothetical protein
MDIYTLIGEFVFWIIIIILILVVIGLALGYLVIKKNKIFLPKVTLWILDVLRFPAEYIANLFTDEPIIDRMCINIMNIVDGNDFAKTEYKERAIFIPHCLRNIDCPAKITYYGLNCVKCGKCCIKNIKEEADRLGYSLSMAPGGRFVERYAEKHTPKAALCVACPLELCSTMTFLSDMGIYVQGVPLLKTGCVNTEVDVKEVINKMQLKY